MIDELRRIEAEALRELESIDDSSRLETFRIDYLGKKGRLTASLKGMGKLSPEERPEAGKKANQVKARLTEAFEARKREIEERDAAAGRDILDVTLPGSSASSRPPPSHHDCGA